MLANWSHATANFNQSARQMEMLLNKEFAGSASHCNKRKCCTAFSVFAAYATYIHVFAERQSILLLFIGPRDAERHDHSVVNEGGRSA